MKLVFLIFLILALVSSAAPPEQRSISVAVTPMKVQFQASYHNESIQDSYTFDLSLISLSPTEILSGNFQFQSNQSQSAFQFQVVGLVEINTTEVDAYGGDSKTIIGSYPDSVEQADWNDWVDASKIVNGVTVYDYSATTKDGVFVVRIRIAAETVEVGQIPIGPNDVKIDFEVNFPHEVPESRVALQTKIASQQPSHNSGAQAIVDYTLAFGGGEDSPFSVFSWLPRATAPVGEVPVIAYTSQSGAASEFDLYFTFMTPGPHPTSIIWDPRIGLDYNAVPSAEFCFASVCGIGAIFIVIGIILGVLLLVGLVLYAIFKRRQGYDSIDSATSYV